MLKNIFSYRTEKFHRVVMILGFKFKFFSSNLWRKNLQNDCLKIKTQLELLENNQKENENLLKNQAKELKNTLEEENKLTENNIIALKKDLMLEFDTLKKQIAENFCANSQQFIKTISSIDEANGINYKTLNNELQKTKRHIHRHIDFTYRDLMVVLENKLNFIPKHNLYLKTDYPIAYESNDYIVPHGTVRDNTRFPRFIRKCEILFPKKEQLSFLDLGCSGGGMVLDAILKGHLGIGLEGSDVSEAMQRAEWRLLKNNLFTCDITQPFNILDKNTNSTFKFDIISAWEVLEHLPEEKINQFLKNLSNHMHQDSYFVATIASWDDIDPKTGINWHVTVKPLEWWKDKFSTYGFKLNDSAFDFADFARAALNPPNCYEDMEEKNLSEEFSKKNFKVVLQKMI